MTTTWVERTAELIKTHNIDECWPWTGTIDPCGYGRAGGGRLAYHLVYAQMVGVVPTGMQLDHLCRNRACVNPAHLEVVTQAVNKLRSTAFSAVNAVKTHCDHGHLFDDANTYVYKGGRHCRACNRDRQRQVKERRRLARVDEGPMDASGTCGPLDGAGS